MEKQLVTKVNQFFMTPLKEYIHKKRVRQNSLYFHYVKTKSVVENSFLFESYHAVNLTGNVYAIFKELIRQNHSGKFYWVTLDVNDPMIPFIKKMHKDTKFVKYESREYYKLLASCKFLINDTSFMPYFVKKAGQIYINTWHGTPLKTLGLDIKNASLSAHKNIQRNLLHTDLLLMPNTFTAEKLLKSHQLDGIYKGDISVTGNARVDAIFGDDTVFREKYDLPKNKKIILFAPTWKKDLNETTDEDIQLLVDQVETIQKSIGDGYKVFLKAHYFIYDKFVELGYGDRIIPNWVDTNELLSCVDKLITDYSSIFFDFLPLKRPIYFYIPDKDSYDRTRGFYLPINEIPGFLSESLDEIIEKLQMDNDEYLLEHKDKIDNFLNSFCYLDDGQAAKRSVEAILEKGNERKEKTSNSDKKIILAYGGGFYNNGITNSLINLSTFIDYEKYELIILESDRMSNEKENNLKKLDPRCKVIYRFSYSFRTLRDTYNQNMFYRQGYDSKFINLKKLKEQFVFEFKRVMGNITPDIVIDFGGYNKTFTSLLAFSDSPKKIMFLHNIMLEEFNKQVKGKYKHRWNLKIIFSTYRLFDKIISVSESACEQNRHDLKRFVSDDSKFDYINNLINGKEILEKKDVYKKINDGKMILSSIDNTYRVPFEEKVNLFGIQTISALVPPNPNNINFINVARLSPEKNQKTLIKAFARLYKENKNVRLMLVGDGPLLNEITSLILEYGLTDVVTLYGFVDNPIPIVNMADCFVFSSNYEGQGIALIEGMILGKHVIGTNVSGIKSVLKDYPDSLVENSVDGLYKGMKNFIDGKLPASSFDYVQYNKETMQKFYSIVCEG